MKKIIQVLIFSMFLTGTFAHSVDFTGEQFEELKTNFNENSDQMSEIFKTMLGNERINIYSEDGHAIHIVMQEGLIQDASNGELDDQTINMFIDAFAEEQLAAGDLDILNLYEEDHIRIEGEGFFSSIKTGLIKFGLWIKDILGIGE